MASVVALSVLAGLMNADGSPGVIAANPASAASAVPGARLDTRPNIVLITTDDQTLAEMQWLPETRRLLGDRGVTFKNFLAPHPLCCPARAQILTGQYAQNNGVRANVGTHGGYQAFHPATALPVWLRRAGYRTAFVGKYLNGYSESAGHEVGWGSWNPTVRAIYQYFGFTQYDNGVLTSLPDAYHTDYVADETRNLIHGYAESTRPFFIWSSYVAPHGTCWMSQERTCSAPPRPATRYENIYPNERNPFLDYPSFNEPNVSDKPGWIADNDLVDPQQMQSLFTQRIRALASLDDAVAGTVQALRAVGKLDNTVIVLTSDNGYLFGQHRVTGKVLAYEESIRVPLLMRGPGLPAGVSRRQTTAMVDLAPTFAALAHARPLVRVDGHSMLGYARYNAPQRDRSVLVQAGAWVSHSPWLFRGVRTDRYTYVHWTEGFVELYDRRRDPFELRNLRRNPRYAAIRRALDRRTRLLATCSGDSCRSRFGPLPRPGPPG